MKDTDYMCATRVEGFTKEMRDWYLRDWYTGAGQFCLGAVIPVPDFGGVRYNEHVANGLAVYAYSQGDSSALEKLVKEKTESCNDYFKGCDVSSLDSVVRYLESIYSNSCASEHPTLLNYGKQAYENIRDYGYPTSLSFRFHRWHTLSDVSHVSYDPSREVLDFDSQFWPPFGVIKQISLDFPGDALKVTWVDNGGIHKFSVRDGKVLEAREKDEEYIRDCLSFVDTSAICEESLENSECYVR